MDPRFIDVLRPLVKTANPEATAITADTDLRKVGIDSMQAIELLFSIEDTFGISLPDEDLNDSTFATAGSLWRAVQAQLQQHDAGASGKATA
ncbi:phosphopantetheine-binding protein [Streptomyces sp. RB6PN25]|uniref:Phosphopantetheine-binding protein n=1 Tax=Streptomyces humicola TaxID=2953240 RepID=A0ABT1PTS1_9ACTN|nr:phosphopantetheine-binding protein [Streptomyces humicola]MCQ4081078.1 phosphopantetheine-binding protein [Streptomyces humicola]